MAEKEAGTQSRGCFSTKQGSFMGTIWSQTLCQGQL